MYCNCNSYKNIYNLSSNHPQNVKSLETDLQQQPEQPLTVCLVLDSDWTNLDVIIQEKVVNVLLIIMLSCLHYSAQKPEATRLFIFS